MKTTFSVEQINALRERLPLKEKDGKLLIGVQEDTTYQILLCDIFLMLKVLIEDNGKNGNDNGNSSEYKR